MTPRSSKVWRETYQNALDRGATEDQAHRLADAVAAAWRRKPLTAASLCPRCGGLIAGTRRTTGRTPLDVHADTCPAPKAKETRP